MAADSTVRSGIISGLLKEEDPLMPKKYQNGKLEIRADVKRPYYFVRVSLPRIDKASGVRRRVREEKKLGFVDEITKKQAMKLRGEVLEVVNSGRFVVQSQIRFKDVARRFVESRLPTFGIATQSQYGCQIDNHLLPAFGEQRLSEIDRPSFEQFLVAKAEAGLGWWARKNLRSVMSAIYEAARGWKLWEGDKPTLGVRIGKKTFVREKRLLTAEQMRRLLAELPDRLRFLVLILFGLGLRISEALALKWSDIDFDGQIVMIRRRWYRGDLLDQTKTEASTAELRMGASMVAEFQRRYPGPHKLDAFLFTAEGGSLPPDDRDLLRLEFRPILKRLNLYYQGFGWHAFRRQNITWKQQVAGATPLEAQKAARHASLDMTYLYTLNDRERETSQQQAMLDHVLVGDLATERKQ
jgi:integrase